MLECVYYRELEEADIDQIKAVHDEWFPIDYDLSYF